MEFCFLSPNSAKCYCFPLCGKFMSLDLSLRRKKGGLFLLLLLLCCNCMLLLRWPHKLLLHCPNLVTPLPAGPRNRTRYLSNAREESVSWTWPRPMLQQVNLELWPVKDEWGAPAHWGSQDWTLQPEKIRVTGPYFASFGGWFGIQETGQVKNEVVFSRCGYFFNGPGLNLDRNEMIYINIHQWIKEMMKN